MLEGIIMVIFKIENSPDRSWLPENVKGGQKIC
jgi:hypothetical protein